MQSGVRQLDRVAPILKICEEILMGLVNQPDDGNQCEEPAKMTQLAL